MTFEALRSKVYVDTLERLRAVASTGKLGGAAARRASMRFVGTDGVSGCLQFALLMSEGCRPSSSVLEIGCGALHAGRPTMAYLEAEHWAGIDPNEWLREVALRDEALRALVERKRPRFLSRDDFDASVLGCRFDYVLSHSILSHASAAQLPQFFENTAKVLAPGGRIVASIRLAEGNDFGSQGSPDGSNTGATDWIYPGVSYFTKETVVETARTFGLECEFRPDYTAFYTSVRPRELHDWMVLRAAG